MPNVKNTDSSGSLKSGVKLSVSNVESEDEAILAVENYLRLNKGEGLELSLPEKGEDGNYTITLKQSGN